MNAHSGHDRFGSARFASRSEISGAGMYRQTATSMLCGFDGRAPLWFDIARGGVCLIAGSQGGKGASIIIPNALHGILRNPLRSSSILRVNLQRSRNSKHLIANIALPGIRLGCMAVHSTALIRLPF